MEDEEDEDSRTTSARSMERTDTDYTAFAEAAKKNLAHVSKDLAELLADLEWEKLWDPEPLAHAAVMEDFLAKVRSPPSPPGACGSLMMWGCRF